MTAESSAAEILSLVKQNRILQILQTCKGKEVLHLLKMIKVADIHAEFCVNEFPGYGKPSLEKARNILRGIGLILPRLVLQANGAALLSDNEVLDTDLLDWTTDILDELGKIIGLERLAACEKLRLTQCTVNSEKHIVIKRLGPDLEAAEHSARNRLLDLEKANIATELQQNIESYKKWHAEWMLDHSDNVSPEFFRKLVEIGRRFAELGRSEFVEAEAFGADSKIGPLTFGQWRKVAETIFAEGFARAHVQDVAMVLSGSAHPAGYLQQLPISISPADLKGFFGDLLPTDDQALYEELRSCFVLNVDQIKRYGDVPDYPNPPLVESGDTVIILKYTRFANPYEFFLSQLLLKYESDLVLARDERETPFQNDLHGLFADKNYIVGKPNTVLHRDDGTDLTDIDAAVYEKETNSLYLFQLYWPDTFATDLRRRENQYKRLRKKTKWLVEVQGWIDGNSVDELLARLGLSGTDIATSAVQIKLIVLSRSWTKFSGKAPYHAGGVWLSWSYFRLLLKQARNLSAPLAEVYGSAQDRVEKRGALKDLPRFYRVGGVEVIVTE